MPLPDTYGMRYGHALMRQHIGCGGWYDRHKLTLQEIGNTMYFAAMNPMAGSFNIHDPSSGTLPYFVSRCPTRMISIYMSILPGHFNPNEIGGTIANMVEPLVNASIQLHAAVSKDCMPTSIKFGASVT